MLPGLYAVTEKTEFTCFAWVKDDTAQSEVTGTRVLATMGLKVVLSTRPCNHSRSPAGKGSDAQRCLRWDVSPVPVRPGPAPGKNVLTLKLFSTCCQKEVHDTHTVSAT